MRLARIDRLIVFGLLVYFFGHLVLRVATPTALTVDDAELLALPQGFAWGYGPQLPLYNWLAQASFYVFGVTEFSIALPKQALLFSMHVMIFAALRTTVGSVPALFAAVGLFWVPNILWEFQRASTHSIAMMAAGAMTCLAWARLHDRPIGIWVLILGAAIGLGAMSKYNYWIIPLALSAADIVHRRFSWRGWACGYGLGMALSFPVYLWIVRNPELAFGSLQKLDLQQATEGTGSLFQAMAGFVTELAALLLIAVAVAWFMRGRDWRMPQAMMPWASAAGIALAAITLGILWAQPAQMSARWLAPLALLFVPPLFALRRQAAKWRNTTYLGATCLLMVLCLGMVGFERLKPDARQIQSFAQLVDQIQSDHAPETVVSSYFLAGNLAFAGAPFAVSDRPVAGRTLYLDRSPPDDSIGFAKGTYTLQTSPSETFELNYILSE